MKTMVKETSLFLTGLMLCTLGVQTGFALNDAHADTVETSTTTSTDTTIDPWAGIDLNHPVFKPDTSDQLSEDQIQQVQKIVSTIREVAQNNSDTFADSTYAQTMITNMDQRGKAGLTAKAAAKLLKIGLKKIGKKGYEKLAKRTGLGLVRLNWTTI